MHLPQIAALPRAAEDPTDPGRAAHPAAEGDGFLAVFSGHDAAGVTEPSRSWPPVGARPAPAGFGEIVDTPGPEAPRRGAIAKTDALEAVLSHTGGVPATVEMSTPDTTETGQAPVVDGRTSVPDDGDNADGHAAGAPAAELSRAAFSDAAIPDAQVVPGLVTPALAAAPHGAPPGRVLEGLAQGAIATGPIPDITGGRVPTAMGGDAGQVAVLDAGQVAVLTDTAAARRAVNAPVAGAEQPAQTIPNDVPGGAGNALRGGALPIGPQSMAADADRPVPAQPADMAREAGSVRPEAQVRPEGNSHRPAAGVQREDPAVSAAARPNRAGAVTPVDYGPTAPAATAPPTTAPPTTTPAGKGIQMPTGSEELAPGVYGSRPEARPEARPAAEADALMPQDTPQAETPRTARSPVAAAAAAPAGPGAEPGAQAAGAGAGAPAAGAGLFGAEPALPETVFGDARGTAQGPSAATPPVFQSSETPRLVALQIAEVVRASGERAVELRLQPEELGRVQLTMSQDATGTLTVSLNVERAETLDLLRRNIDLLNADLQELGYQSVVFSFQGDGAGGEQGARPDWADGPGAGDADTENTSAGIPQSGGRAADAPNDGIDIRI